MSKAASSAVIIRSFVIFLTLPGLGGTLPDLGGLSLCALMWHACPLTPAGSLVCIQSLLFFPEPSSPRRHLLVGAVNLGHQSWATEWYNPALFVEGRPEGTGGEATITGTAWGGLSLP